MNSKPSKNHQKIVAPRKRVKDTDLRERLMPYVRDLRRTTYVSKDVARLTRALLTTTARYGASLSEDDTLVGVTGAALLASYAFDRDPAELCAWLRSTADSLERTRPKQ